MSGVGTHRPQYPEVVVFRLSNRRRSRTLLRPDIGGCALLTKPRFILKIDAHLLAPMLGRNGRQPCGQFLPELGLRRGIGAAMTWPRPQVREAPSAEPLIDTGQGPQDAEFLGQNSLNVSTAQRTDFILRGGASLNALSYGRFLLGRQWTSRMRSAPVVQAG